MKSFYKDNIFNDTDFSMIKGYVLNHIENSNDFNYTKIYGRYWNTVDFNSDINSLLINTARSGFDVDDLEIVYTQCVKYQIKDGVIPSLGNHIDDFYATHTLNIIIDSTLDWPLTVGEIDFPSLTNSAVFLKGDEDFHSRPKYPSENENDYIIAIFVNFAPANSEIIKKSNRFKSLPKEVRQTMKLKMTPNDVNLY
jgi:hypothetical protein